jgi:hypothetical protein
VEESQRRRAANEAVFRRVNESIETLQRQFAAAEGEPLSLVCECGHIECTGRVEISLETYERVRSESATFFVIPGHDDPQVEEIVERTSEYLIVRKLPGEPQELAELTDPRS